MKTTRKRQVKKKKTVLAARAKLKLIEGKMPTIEVSRNAKLLTPAMVKRIADI